MEFPISDNIQPPQVETKVCVDCGKDLPLAKFSLKRGKHSKERKTYCTTCESQRRKARAFKLSPEQLEELLSLPCSICGSEDSSRVDIDPETRKVFGVLCKPCHDFLRNIGIDPQNVESVLNYVLIRRDFPFWHKELIKRRVKNLEPATPLIDWIENARE